MGEAEEIPLFFTLIPVLALLSNYAQENCLINVGTEGAKLKFPDAQDIVGIATETEPAITRSEDLMYLDARIWTDENAVEARQMQVELGLLTNATEFRGTAKAYPDVDVPHDLRNTLRPRPNPRNKPCPCGSGLKYKKCHGR